MTVASDADWRCWFLLSRGVPLQTVLDRTGLTCSEAIGAVERVAADIEDARKQADDGVRVPPLFPTFGNSGKPYATMTCADVHPCKLCKGLGCDECNGTGVGSLDDDRSPFFCGVCYASGWDGAAELIPYPLPESETEAKADDGLLGGKS